MRELNYLQIMAFCCMVTIGSCSKASNNGLSNGGKKPDDQTNRSSSATADDSSKNVVVDYPPRYCDHVSKFQPNLRADISQHLRYFCNGSVPTKEMLELREFLIKNPGKLEIRKVKAENDEANDSSEFQLVWGYYAPNIRPFKVKSLPFFSYIAKDLDEATIQSKTTSTRLSDDTLGPNMHIWSAELFYDLKIQASPTRSLAARRKTQYNLYQVESGNEEMGLGVEHLVDGFKGEYKSSVLINLSFNDGQGFNDGKGGTIVLNLLQLTMDNKGFPELTTKALDRLGNFLAQSMYDGFMGK